MGHFFYITFMTCASNSYLFLNYKLASLAINGTVEHF